MEPKTNSNMELLKKLGRDIKNIFVGSHRGEDFILENIEKMDKIEENPRPEEEIADAWFDDHYMPELGEPPSWEDTAPSEYEPPDEEITMHERMYRIATAKYNPFSIGGSEQLGGGSEEIQK